MTTDEHDLRDTARSLAWLYRLLHQHKYTTPPPREVRTMRATPGPRDPVATWIVNAEDCLLEERNDDGEIPGGLRVMVHDAASTIEEKIPREGERPTGAELCDFVAWHANLIATDFPAVDDLAELMEQQTRWLGRKLTPPSADEVAKRTEPYQLAEVIIQRLASRGVTVTREQLRQWVSRGYITSKIGVDGRARYRGSEVLAHLTSENPGM